MACPKSALCHTADAVCKGAWLGTLLIRIPIAGVPRSNTPVAIRYDSGLGCMGSLPIQVGLGQSEETWFQERSQREALIITNSAAIHPPPTEAKKEDLARRIEMIIITILLTHGIGFLSFPQKAISINLQKSTVTTVTIIRIVGCIEIVHATNDSVDVFHRVQELVKKTGPLRRPGTSLQVLRLDPPKSRRSRIGGQGSANRNI